MALTFKQALAQFWQQIALQFVRKENGKGLSANDFTDEDKAKLAAIDTTATINDATISIAAGAGLTGSGDFTTNQANAETITLGHSNSVTAGTAQGSATKTLTFGDTFTIPTVTYDAQGHITAKGTTTMTMPANPNVDTGATSVETTGSGNAITNASYDAVTRKITLTKDAQFVTLDESGKVPTSQLPSYVDDVLEYTSKGLFPTTGETGKIYVDLTTNLAYRWGGSSYVEISPSLALGETSSTAFAGDKGAAAYAHAVTNKGIAKSAGLYKITTNSEGHVTAATAVEKSDITGLGIPAQDTVYIHPAGNAANKASGLYKIATDANSHVSSVTAVTKADITGLGIPAQDTVYTHPSHTSKGSGLYKITVDSLGHVSAATTVQKSDITGLGIPAQDTVYTHPSHTAKSSGLYKITVDNLGHVSAATVVQKSDITALGIPAQDTTYESVSNSTIDTICGQVLADISEVTW